MHISITNPLGRAWARTKEILFKPFNAGKWFVLGFCAFLAYLGEGGCGSSGFQAPGGGGPGPAGRGPGGMNVPPSAPQAWANWIQANLTLIIVVGLVGLLVVLGLAVLVTWLRSRGKFMFLDGLAHNRAAVVEPWKRLRAAANSHFAFSLVLALAAFGALILTGALAGFIAWQDIEAQRFGSAALAGVLTGGLIGLVLWLAFVIISLLLEDFVIPAMYLREVPVMEAWAIVRREILPGNAGTLTLFYLFKIVLVIAAGITTILATCATCCLALIPYLGTVILLPISVFMRCYTLYFVEQFGPSWRVIELPDWPPRCQGCQYDLRYNASGYCPECGMPIETVPRNRSYKDSASS